MLSLEKPPTGQSMDLETPLQRILDLVKKRGLVILISDLMAPIDTLDQGLTAIRACGHEVQVFQVLDPAERHFTFDQANLFEDVETGQEIYIDPQQARAGYLERLESHLNQVESICRQNGIGYRLVTTEEPLERQLFDFLQTRAQPQSTARR